MNIYSQCLYIFFLKKRIVGHIKFKKIRNLLIVDEGGFGHVLSSLKIAERIFSNNDFYILLIGWQRRFARISTLELISPKILFLDLSLNNYLLRKWIGNEPERFKISKNLLDTLKENDINVKRLSDIYKKVNNTNTSYMNKAGVFLHESICLGSKPEYSEVMVKYRKNIENQLDIDFDNSVVIYSRRKGEKSRDISNYGRNGSEWSEYLPLLNYIISKKLHIILVGDKSKQCIKYFKDIINSNLLIGNSGDIEDYQKFTMLATSNAKFYIGDQGGNNLIRALFRKKSLVINGFYGTEVLPFSFFAFKKIIDNSTEIKKGSYRNDESSKFATLASHNSIEILAFFQFYMDNINTIGLMDQDVSVVKDKLFLNNSTSRLIEYTSKGKVIFK